MRWRSFREEGRRLPCAEEAGAAIVLVAVAIFSIVSMLTLAVDGVMAMRGRSQLMMAGDLGSLRGVASISAEGDAARAERLATLVAKANLAANSRLSKGLLSRWQPQLSVQAMSTEGVSSVQFQQTLQADSVFGGVLPEVLRISSVSAVSEARVQLAQSYDERPLAAVLVVDRSDLMRLRFGAQCGLALGSCSSANEGCSKGCRPFYDAALDAARFFLDGLHEEDLFSVLAVGRDVDVVQGFAPARQERKDAAQAALESYRDEVFAGRDELLPNYAAALYEGLGQLKTLLQQGETLSDRNVVVLLISSGQLSEFRNQSEEFPKGEACPAFWEACQLEYQRCTASAGADCKQSRESCYVEYSSENEEYAGIFRQQLQEDFKGRFSVIGLGSFEGKKMTEDYLERQEEFLLALSGDYVSPLSGAQDRLRCSASVSRTRAGRFRKSGPAVEQLAKAVNEVLEHARARVSGDSEKPRLVFPQG